MRNTCWLGQAIGLTLLLLGIVRGQETAPPGAKPFEETGMVEAVLPEGAGLQIKTDTALWIVRLASQCEPTIEGEAEPNYLRPGLTVRFTAKIDKKSTVRAPLEEIEVFVPQGKAALGFFADKREDSKPVRSPSQNANYEIRGKISNLKGNHIVVVAGGKKVFAKLADDVKINVSLNDLSLAQVGDETTINGWTQKAPMTAFNQPGLAVAESLVVKLSKPLEGKLKPGKSSSVRSGRGGKHKSGAETTPASSSKETDADQAP